MALYWPEARTALFVIDDPTRGDPIDDEDGYGVALISLPQESSVERYLGLVSSFAWLLGENDPEEADPDRWDRRLRPRPLLHLNDITAFDRLV